MLAQNILITLTVLIEQPVTVDTDAHGRIRHKQLWTRAGLGFHHIGLSLKRTHGRLSVSHNI